MDADTTRDHASWPETTPAPEKRRRIVDAPAEHDKTAGRRNGLLPRNMKEVTPDIAPTAPQPHGPGWENGGSDDRSRLLLAVNREF